MEVAVMLEGRLLMPMVKGLLRLIREHCSIPPLEREVIGLIDAVAALSFEVVD
jgi:hypothetical protein